MLLYNPRLKKYSQELRKDMTDAERLLWSRLRGKQLKGLQVYRQRIIGNHIVDFYCPKAKLVVEVDGGQHYNEKETEKDRIRDGYLNEKGLNVLRFSDSEVLKDIDSVLASIYENIISPNPSLEKRG